MSYLKENKNTLLYGTALITLAVIGSSLVYYVIEDDKRVQRRKEKKLAHRTTLRLLTQMKEEDVLPIEAKISQVEATIDDTTCDDKAFKLKEYTLAHSNELLLQLMEKLDAIRPQSVITAESAEPTAFELELTSSLKSKKRSVIEAIQELFKRLDLVNVKAKKESLRREEAAAKQAQLEREEAERKAREEKELEELRKENERKAREEQERIAQEEALRRQQEEKEAAAVLSESKDDLVILNKETAFEEVEVNEEQVEIEQVNVEQVEIEQVNVEEVELEQEATTVEEVELEEEVEVEQLVSAQEQVADVTPEKEEKPLENIQE